VPEHPKKQYTVEKRVRENLSCPSLLFLAIYVVRKYLAFHSFHTASPASPLNKKKFKTKQTTKEILGHESPEEVL